MTEETPKRKPVDFGLTLQSRTGSKTPAAAFRAILVLAVVLPLSVLGALIVDVLLQGGERLDWTMLTEGQHVQPEDSGLYNAIVGSIWLMSLTAIISVPFGVGAAIYLEEYAPKNRFTRLLEVNITNLAGVPSIVYGLLGLAVFVRFAGFGPSVIAGACTLSLLVLPVIITASRESLRQVPPSVREASFALGGDHFSTIRRVVLPMSLPGMLTGVILALSRAVGEAAPIIVAGAAAMTTRAPQGTSTATRHCRSLSTA